MSDLYSHSSFFVNIVRHGWRILFKQGAIFQFSSCFHIIESGAGISHNVLPNGRSVSTFLPLAVGCCNQFACFSFYLLARYEAFPKYVYMTG
jgi:hypothetical protein